MTTPRLETQRPVDTAHHATVEGEAAARYARMAELYMADDFRRFADLVVELAPQARTVLELGTVAGLLATELANLLPECRITAVEHSQTTIELARDRAARFGLAGRTDFQRWADVDLPFPSESFDCVVAIWSLHHWREPLRVLDTVHRVLRLGCRLVLVDIRRDATEDEISRGTAHAPRHLSDRLRAQLHEYYVVPEVARLLDQSAFKGGVVLEDGYNMRAIAVKRA